ERDHAGGEMVAVLVDQALDVALEKALALEPFVEKGGIGCVALRQPRIDDLDAAAKLDAEGIRAVAHAVLAADEEGRPESLVAEGRSGADHLLLLPFREDHALRPSPQPLVDALENSGHRIAARAQLRPVRIHVDDGAPGDAAVHGGGGDGGRDER